MSKNLEAIFNQKEKELEKTDDCWRPNGQDEGNYVFWMIPQTQDLDDDGNPIPKPFWEPYKFHQIGATRYPCYGRDKCYACKIATSLWDGNDRDGERSTLAKKLFANERYLFKIWLDSVLGEKVEENNLQVYETGKEVYNKVKTLITDKDVGYGWFVRPDEKGRPFVLVKKGKGRDSRYKESTAAKKPRPLANLTDENERQKIIDEANKIEWKDYLPTAYHDENDLKEAVDLFTANALGDDILSTTQKSKTNKYEETFDEHDSDENSNADELINELID